MIKILILSFLLIPISSSAQESNPFEWSEGNRKLAGHISDLALLTQITLDTIDTFKREDKWAAFKCQSIRLGAALGSAEATKRLIHRTRPDGTDNKSFFSMHTALAFSASGWNFNIGIPIASGVGYGRMAADKHYITDILGGIVAGFGAMKLCEK